MAEYNGYKIKRTHSLTPLTSVYEAESAQGQPGRFALKVFHPPASANIRRSYAIEGWLLAAERQQQSAKKDGAVVEVLTFGRCEEGAFAVYPWQERFLEPLIKTLHPKGNTLRALAECLLNTIEKWEKETGGPHGNLKPANVFLTRSGPLAGMTAQLSDPAFLPGAKPETQQLADLNAVGSMLATIVRRRLPGAWPIEEAPEWKALGHPGKGWLDFCNYLLNPQPGEGEVTLAKARLHLKKVPKDANPVKTAVLTLAALVVLSGVGIVGFARFGDPIYMPEQLQRMAGKIGNTRFKPETPEAWARLCAAWDTWLIDLQSNGPRLLRTDGLLEPGDPLRKAIADFLQDAKSLRPEALVPVAASEKRLGVLGKSPPQAVLDELQLPSVFGRVTEAGERLIQLQRALVNWQKWEQLRALQKRLEERGYTRTAAELSPRLPQAVGTAGYRLDIVRTLKLLNDISLDNTGTLPLASRWGEISQLTADMTAVEDWVQKGLPDFILGRLEDKSSLSDFADSLVNPLEEMRLRRNQYRDPQVVRERFLKESPLLQAPGTLDAEVVKRWEEELTAFTLVPKTPAEDPRLATTFTDSQAILTRDSPDLETEAPAGEPDQPATLSASLYQRESETLAATLKALRDRPIVRRDLPAVAEETNQLAAAFRQLVDRLAYTLSLLKPETWLAKIAQPYGTFTASQQRWAAWKQVALNGVTADALRGPPNRARFRALRDAERDIKGWIDGLEGLEGFGALKVPDLEGTVAADTVTELKRLEGRLREEAATAAVAAQAWTNAALPATRWENAVAAVRAPLEQHSGWLGRLRDFGQNLDELGRLLGEGFGWTEGVSETIILLTPATSRVEDLGGRPGGWYKEARLLEPLVNATDVAVLTAAVQSGGFAQKLMAWRRLGTLAAWPANVKEYDLDGAVIGRLRELVGSSVKDEARRTGLIDELVQGTKLRFNRAARAVAPEEGPLAEMFNRMKPAKLTEADLDEPVAYNLAYWRLLKSDWNEKSLDRLAVRRDAFVKAVQALPGIREIESVKNFVAGLSAIELKDNDPNRLATTSPATVGWAEEPDDEGMSLIALWRNGGRTVQMKYYVVLPPDESDTPPFFLAERVVAVGEFLDLMAGRPKDAPLVKEALPEWAKRDTPAKPYDVPISWRPRSDFTGLELNSPNWFYAPTSMVKGLFDDPALRASNPPLEQAAAEKPSLRSPLQQVPPAAAKIFAEKMLGARLPTAKEWQAVLKVTAADARNGFFRGPNFQKLFEFLKNYNAGGQSWVWRPNSGIYAPSSNDLRNDDGRAGPGTDESRLWFREVDEGPKSGRFINLLGNVSVFLAGDKPNEKDYYVAGGSVLSPPGIDFTQPQKITASGGPIGGRGGMLPYSDVGLRPAFDAPPGFKERYNLLRLVRGQKYLTL